MRNPRGQDGILKKTGGKEGEAAWLAKRERLEQARHNNPASVTSDDLGVPDWVLARAERWTRAAERDWHGVPSSREG